MNAFLIAFFLIFIAEMGDKTQFVAIAFASRYRIALVLSAVLAASMGVQLISVLLGEAAGHLVPPLFMNLFAGACFIGFGLWALLARGENDKDEPAGWTEKIAGKLGPFLTIALTFFAAEIGDKTMLATFTIASQQHSVLAVWAGSSLGMFSANLVPMLLGKFLFDRLPDTALRYASALAFFCAGALTFAHTI